MIFLLLFTAAYVPFRLAFLDQVHITLTVIEYLVDILFAIDISVNFFSAYYDESNEIVKDKGKIAKNYLKTWFIPDLMAWYDIYIYI